nr:glycoside hydrolase family 95 protein [Prevotella sp.]
QAYHIYQKLLTYVDAEHYNGTDKRHGGGTYANLLDAHPPFQIDGNFGGTAGVCEMLIQSNANNEIELLPALPAAWKEGAVSGLCARGGYEVSMEWNDGKVTACTIKAKKAGVITLLYNGKTKTLKLKAGEVAGLTLNEE